jgi:hypothetical protein
MQKPRAMSRKKGKRMKNDSWDIVDVVGPAEDLTERQMNPRGHSRGSGSSAAVLVVGLAWSLSVTISIPRMGGTSDVISVVHRARKRTVERRAESAGQFEESTVDFRRARTGESLARAFDSYFRAPDDSQAEAEPDDSCFF